MDDPPPPYDFKQAPPTLPAQQSPSSSSSYYPSSSSSASASTSTTYSYAQYASSAQATQQQQQGLPPRYPANPAPPSSSSSSSSPSSHPLAAPLRARTPIGIYSAGLRDVALSLSGSVPPLAHVTIHSLRTPSIALHSTAQPTSRVLATAQFNLLSATDIEIYAPRTTGMGSGAGAGAGSALRVELVKTGWMPDAWGFDMPWSSGSGSGMGVARDRFEWRYSRGAEVAALEGRSRGLKCVRVATGEVVCVWAWSVSLKKAGKFRWVAAGPEWGDAAELMVVMTLLAVVERIKRDESSGG